MKEITGLKDWILDKKFPNAKRFAVVTIFFQYPDQALFINLKPKERIKAISKNFRDNYQKLLDLGIFESLEIQSSKKKPQIITGKLRYNQLKNIAALDYIYTFSIQSIDNAVHQKKETVQPDRYFCVKMTVVIEVEGISSKKQDLEKRFVLIKAKSSDDAYEKLEKSQDEYVEPYLNPQGRFVRWRIESYDDCFETDIQSPADLDGPAGVEVYSKLSKRKNTGKTVWGGKL
ncbi:DUF4288 domain-containing protein [Mucilaginibacter celer]|uniref:DUF4288 domain-containing protein n=1 Tax=Mucilaginibacter celer TaxID=2305508 RepID=A0A494VTG5_9SPHI|nr:DUF4288 domain-containing protein [Mucilaginibacter celer]AYL94688.1 DUF4288 domain-containing protein [Mucilaginibacter celer]